MNDFRILLVYIQWIAQLPPSFLTLRFKLIMLTYGMVHTKTHRTALSNIKRTRTMKKKCTIRNFANENIFIYIRHEFRFRSICMWSVVCCIFFCTCIYYSSAMMYGSYKNLIWWQMYLHYLLYLEWGRWRKGGNLFISVLNLTYTIFVIGIVYGFYSMNIITHWNIWKPHNIFINVNSFHFFSFLLFAFGILFVRNCIKRNRK